MRRQQKINGKGIFKFSIIEGLKWGVPVYLINKLIQIWYNGLEMELETSRVIRELLIWTPGSVLFGYGLWFIIKRFKKEKNRTSDHNDY